MLEIQTIFHIFLQTTVVGIKLLLFKNEQLLFKNLLEFTFCAAHLSDANHYSYIKMVPSEFTSHQQMGRIYDHNNNSCTNITSPCLLFSVVYIAEDLGSYYVGSPSAIFSHFFH